MATAAVDEAPGKNPLVCLQRGGGRDGAARRGRGIVARVWLGLLVYKGGEEGQVACIGREEKIMWWLAGSYDEEDDVPSPHVGVGPGKEGRWWAAPVGLLG
jgi:hypothetical protein